jgi:hypothetical protein
MSIEAEQDNKPNPANMIKFAFSKKVTDLDLFKYSSVKDLFNYVNGQDVELNTVKLFIKKANREMRIGNNNRRLFIRKISGLDEEANSRICVTTK